jgi:hypothetical protein
MVVFSDFQTLFGSVSPLFAHRAGAEVRAASIRDFGIEINVATLQEPYGILKVRPLTDKPAFLQWLAFVKAEAVSVEAEDLNVMVPDRIVRNGMVQNWAAIVSDLDKLVPQDLYTAVESAAVKVFSARPEQGTSEETKQTLEAMRQAGIADPMEKWNRIDAQRQKEAADAQARTDRAVDGFMAEQETPQEPIYSHSGFLVNPQEEEF